MNGDDTDLFALGAQIVYALLDGLGNRAHGDDDVFGVGSTVVRKRLVCTTRNLRYFGHGFGNHIGYGIVEPVGGLARLEIDVGILGGTASYGVLGIQCTCTECLEGITVEQRRECGLVDKLDLLYLVRRTESVEEVQERDTRLDGNEVCHTREVHNLLYGRGSQHGETGLACSHDILMVAEDRERLSGERTGRNVEYARQQFARNLVHVGNHQQQTLRCGEGRGQSAALERSVDRTGSTSLRLHFNNLYGLTEDVLASLGGPLVDEFSHCGRRRNGVNRRNFREHIRDMRRSVVTVTCNEFFFCHIPINC